MTEFQEKLKVKMDEYVKLVYSLTSKFPKEEIYGSANQWRRAALSVILNYIEGYARRRLLVRYNFIETSYGSFKESKYLQNFAKTQNYISETEYSKCVKLSEEIGAMLWTEIISIEKSLKRQ
jgi:four helix bundle protein